MGKLGDKYVWVRSVVPLFAVAVVLLLGACSGDSQTASSTSTTVVTTSVVPSTSTLAPSTTSPVTTAVPITVAPTTAVSTTAAPTTVAVTTPGSVVGGEPDWRAVIENFYVRMSEIQESGPDPALVTEFCLRDSPCAKVHGNILMNLQANGERVVNDIPPTVVSAERVPGMEFNPETTLSAAVQAVVIFPENPDVAIVGPDGEVVLTLEPGPSVRVGEEYRVGFLVARHSVGEPWQVFQFIDD